MTAFNIGSIFLWIGTEKKNWNFLITWFRSKILSFEKTSVQSHVFTLKWETFAELIVIFFCYKSSNITAYYIIIIYTHSAHCSYIYLLYPFVKSNREKRINVEGGWRTKIFYIIYNYTYASIDRMLLLRLCSYLTPFLVT